MRLAITMIGILLALLIGCSGSGDSSGQDSGGTDGTVGEGEGEGGEDTGFSTDDGTGGEGEGEGESCRLVDVVIAVDGSSSMSEELKAMREEVFPAFAERLASLGEGLDNFRVATIDACPDPANYHTRGAANDCGFSSGKPWIDSASPALSSEFSCVGDIYLEDQNCSGDNDDEQPASAIAASLEEPVRSGANAGFVRDDALLVVVAITDEDEQPTGAANTAQLVYERLVATKGDVSRIVFLGIGGGQQCSGVYGQAESAELLQEITGLFSAAERGVFWDLCAGHLEDGLEDAFAIIEQACDEFIPPL